MKRKKIVLGVIIIFTIILLFSFKDNSKLIGNVDIDEYYNIHSESFFYTISPKYSLFTSKIGSVKLYGPYEYNGENYIVNMWIQKKAYHAFSSNATNHEPDNTIQVNEYQLMVSEPTESYLNAKVQIADNYLTIEINRNSEEVTPLNQVDLSDLLEKLLIQIFD